MGFIYCCFQILTITIECFIPFNSESAEDLTTYSYFSQPVLCLLSSNVVLPLTVVFVLTVPDRYLL